MKHLPDKMSKRRHLLLVDDDITSLEFMKKYLEEHFILHAAVDAEHALELIKQNTYYGFLIDIKLGAGMDGVALMKKLRSHFKYRYSPIIAVTAFFKPSDIAFLINKGFDDVVIKPFNKFTLLDKLQTQVFI